jgi:signal transduction histidine kinase
MIVRDNGMGIELEDQSRIFERFERAITDQEIRGMGLGLYISKNIVEAHGGSIRLISEPGSGSEFSVIIPTHNAECALTLNS